MSRYVAALDFGTANSGVAWGPDNNDVTSRFHYVNSTGGYAKTRTALLVRKSLLDKIASSRWMEERLAMLSRAAVYGASDNPDVDLYFGTMGVEHAREAVRKEKDGWVFFEYFKMQVGKAGDAESARIKGSDGSEWPLSVVIALFIRCLKVTAEKAIHDVVSAQNVRFKPAEDVRWAVTIPTIWKDNGTPKDIMKAAIRLGLGDGYLLVLEPEGAAASLATMVVSNSDPLSLGAGTRYLVVDCGGGTTDIVAHEIQPDGRAREIRQSDGKAIAGWDMDERFWRLFADKVAGGRIANPFDRLIDDLRHDESRYYDWLQLEREWLKIKEEKLRWNSDDEYLYPFIVPPWYERWIGKHYGELADSFDDDGAIYFTQKEIRDDVCMPVVEQIISKAETFARSCGCRFDYVFLVGGLSALKFLQVRFEAMATQLGCRKGAICEENWKGTQMFVGGSIMRGAIVLMVFRKMIQRITTRNYYYKLYVKLPSGRFSKQEAVEMLKKYYDMLHVSDAEWGQLAVKIYRSVEYVPDNCLDCRRENGQVYVNMYVPICLRGVPASVYVNRGVRRIDGMEGKVVMYFYSSKDSLFFVTKTPDSRVQEEGVLRIHCRAWDCIDVEVDFNEAHQDTLVAKLTNSDNQTTVASIVTESQLGY